MAILHIYTKSWLPPSSPERRSTVGRGRQWLEHSGGTQETWLLVLALPLTGWVIFPTLCLSFPSCPLSL